MLVGIETEAAQFLFWEYLFRIFSIVSLQCMAKNINGPFLTCSVTAATSGWPLMRPCRGEMLTLVRMALLAPQCRIANTFKCPCSASPPADPKLVSEDTNKIFYFVCRTFRCKDMTPQIGG